MQALLALHAYPIMRRAAVQCMERNEVSAGLFSDLAFQGASLSSIWSLLSRGERVFVPGPRGAPTSGWKVRNVSLTALAMLVACTYIMGFSTLVSIMTGYQTTFVAYVQDPKDSSNLVKTTALDSPVAIIADGDRLNLTADFPVIAGTAYKEATRTCRSLMPQ